ncbi:MAG: YraN family protein [Desulfobacterales bacterium]|nr:YraN family protein [Desulfobacterales bacterium]
MKQATYKQKLGQQGESIAEKFLLSQGYSIIEKNYRTRFGEIDIIAKDNNYICFIEVKLRKTKSFGCPKDSVNYGKQRKISMTAMDYLKKSGQNNQKARFDVVSISISDTNEHQIEIIKNAFETFSQ